MTSTWWEKKWDKGVVHNIPHLKIHSDNRRKIDKLIYLYISIALDLLLLQAFGAIITIEKGKEEYPNKNLRV